MTKYLMFSMIAATLVACNNEPKQTVQASEAATVTNAADSNKTTTVYIVDTTQSNLAWEGYEGLALGKSEHNGVLKISSGSISMQDNIPASCKFTIAVNSLKVLDIPADKSGNAKLVKHLSSADFFDVAKFPEAIFEVTNAVANGTDSVNITGNLTLKGVTKSITMPAAIKITGDSLTATTPKFYINRKDWGMFYRSENSLGDEMIRNEMGIVINLVARK